MSDKTTIAIADARDMLHVDCNEAGRNYTNAFDDFWILCRVGQDLMNGEPASDTLVKHRRAWRAALGLPALEN